MTDRTEDTDGTSDVSIAGEYVLGTLSADDRRRVEARMAVDEKFARHVQQWQSSLSSLNGEIDDIQPPSETLAIVQRRLFGATAMPSAGPVATLWASVALWRGLTAATLLAVTGLGLYQAFLTPQQEARTLVAELSAANTPFNLAMSYDAARGLLRVVPVALQRPEPRSLEIWVIEDGKVPRSVGLLPEDGNGEIAVGDDVRKLLAEGMTIAITIEPPGGAPDGKPTGPVIASGTTRLL